MGLSDGERFDRIIHTVNRISKLPKFKKLDSAKKLNQLIAGLWPALIGNTSNGGYWLFGGELASDHVNEIGVLSAAFRSVQIGPDKEGMLELDPEKAKTPEQKEDWEDFDYVKNFRPDVSKFISGYMAEDQQRLLELYAEWENYSYAANRYRDQFAKRMRPVTNIMTKIGGICFDEFSQSNTYVIAWMLGNIFERVLPNTSKDFVVKWFREQNLHHDVRKPQGKENEKWIYDTFADWQVRTSNATVQKNRIALEKSGGSYINKKNKNRNVLLSTDERVKFVLRLLEEARKYYYPHQHEWLFKAIETHNKSCSNDKIDLKYVKAACARLTELHAKKEAESTGTYRQYCHLTHQEV